MKIALFGANGMLGYSFYRKLIYLKSTELYCITRNSSKNFENNIIIKNFLDVKLLEKIFKKERFDWVINCAGHIKQNNYENIYDIIMINSVFPHELSKLSNKFNFRLLHFSTDCVFSGSDGNYSDNATHDAIDVYGKTKSLGEVCGDNILTIRTSIIGHGINPNNSLVDWFISRKSKKIYGYKGAIFSGLPSIFIAEFFCKYLQNNSISGIFNLSTDPISKFDLLDKINKVYNLGITILPETKTIIDRSLNSKKLFSILNYNIPSWNDLINLMYLDYKNRWN